jgi:hypothetical protein
MQDQTRPLDQLMEAGRHELDTNSRYSGGFAHDVPKATIRSAASQ